MQERGIQNKRTNTNYKLEPGKKEYRSSDIFYAEMITFLSLLDGVGWGESLQIIFSCWWSLNYITNSTGNKQAGASYLHDITLPHIMTFIALALRMGRDMTEKL